MNESNAALLAAFKELLDRSTLRLETRITELRDELVEFRAWGKRLKHRIEVVERRA